MRLCGRVHYRRACLPDQHQTDCGILKLVPVDGEPRENGSRARPNSCSQTRAAKLVHHAPGMLDRPGGHLAVCEREVFSK